MEEQNRKDLVAVEVGGNAVEYMTVVNLSQEGRVLSVKDAEGQIWDKPKIIER